MSIDRATDFIPANGAYFLSHSVGRPLASAQTHFKDSFFSPWESSAGDPWGAWMGQLNGFCEALATLTHARPSDICPQSNLSSAFTKVLSSLPKRAGQPVIVLSEHDFPTMGFVADQAQKLGYALRFLPRMSDHTDPQVWEDALSDDVQWLLVTQVQSNTGVQVPVADIVAAAKRRDVLTIVDVAQGTGVLPVDVSAWDADFVLGSCVKWLCGGPGAGFLWVNPARIADCQPQDVGWFSHANPFEFDIHHFAYHPGAFRFWGGTPSVAPFVLAAHSIRYFSDIGVDVVRTHNLALTQRIMDALPEGWLVSPRAPSQRSGTLLIHAGDQQQAVQDALKSREIRFDIRATGMRLSPHIYTTAAEVDLLIDTMLHA
ncbi:aminotransferase class V-fold PLP-dependent enzyme [Burkholderiaceae bacterium DAT-1]|nr:aminotransferase class V-fold PLP-dependent enzyme [Burkholderiaceae bacterium DAT-1]